MAPFWPLKVVTPSFVNVTVSVFASADNVIPVPADKFNVSVEVSAETVAAPTWTLEKVFWAGAL